MRRRSPAVARTTLSACLILAAWPSACAHSDEPRLVTIPQTGVRPASHVDGIFDYRTAVAAIAGVFEKDLGFAPFPVTFRFYPGRAAFEAALVEVGYDPSFARTTARTMTAVGGYRGVLLNESAVASMVWAQRTLLLAHELTHSLQYELGGGRRGTSDQWLREGFAEWVSIRVLDRLGGMSLASFRRERHNELRRAGRGEVPRLHEMVTFREWVEIGTTRGTAAYALAYLAVDRLIDQHGVDAVVDYFARFAASPDRLANFQGAFGVDLDAFDTALQQALWSR